MKAVNRRSFLPWLLSPLMALLPSRRVEYRVGEGFSYAAKERDEVKIGPHFIRYPDYTSVHDGQPTKCFRYRLRGTNCYAQFVAEGPCCFTRSQAERQLGHCSWSQAKLMAAVEIA